MKKRRGFTIVELVIVIAVIGILAAVMLPEYSAAMEKTQSLSAKLNMNAMNKQVKAFAYAEGAENLLSIYASLYSEYGEERVFSTLKRAVYDAENIVFLPLEECKDPARADWYYPVYTEDGLSAEQSLRSLRCVEYSAGEEAFLIQKLNLEHTEQNTAFQNVYVVRSSLVLLSDLNLSDSCLVLVNGAGLALNGYTLTCGHLLLVCTDRKDTLSCVLQDGVVHVGYGMSALTAEGFETDGQTNFSDYLLTPTHDAQIRLSLSADLHLYAGNLILPSCTELSGSILIGKDSQIRLPDNAKLRIRDHACLLTNSGFPVKLYAKSASASLTVGETSLYYVALGDGSESIQVTGNPNPLSLVRPSLCSITLHSCETTLASITERCRRAAEFTGNTQSAKAVLTDLCSAISQSAPSSERQKVTTLTQTALDAFPEP